MIILITYTNKEDNRVYIDHGYDMGTGNTVILPNIPIFDFYPKRYDENIGGYYIPDSK